MRPPEKREIAGQHRASGPTDREFERQNTRLLTGGASQSGFEPRAIHQFVNGSVTQQARDPPFKRSDRGSSPRRPTNFMKHLKQINAAVREQGVLWHACEGCGRDWPFPRGDYAAREWRCAVCLHAEWSRLRREDVALTRLVAGVAERLDRTAAEEIAVSSNGKTPDLGPGDAGSNPATAAIGRAWSER